MDRYFRPMLRTRYFLPPTESQSKRKPPARLERAGCVQGADRRILAAQPGKNIALEVKQFPWLSHLPSVRRFPRSAFEQNCAAGVRHRRAKQGKQLFLL